MGMRDGTHVDRSFSGYASSVIVRCTNVETIIITFVVVVVCDV